MKRLIFFNLNNLYIIYKMSKDNYIFNKIYIINHKKDRFIFLKSNIETLDIISKLNRNLSKNRNIFTNVTDDEKMLLVK